MKTNGYIQIDGERIAVQSRPGKHATYLVKRSAPIAHADPLLEFESAFLSRPENKRLLKLLEEGKTLTLA